MTEKIQVRAKKLGYHDLKRRREGNVFGVNPSEFSSNWMEKLEDSPSAESGRSSDLKSKRVETKSKQLDLEVI